MPSKEEDFKHRFHAIVTDTRDGASNPDEMLMIGSLADRIVTHAGHTSWTRFKTTLTQPAYNALLTSFQNQGNALAKQGAMRQMRTVEVLACSLVARTQKQDPEVVADDRVLDRLIEDALRLYRDQQTADPIIS